VEPTQAKLIGPALIVIDINRKGLNQVIEIKIYKNAIDVTGHAKENVCSAISAQVQLFGALIETLDTFSWWGTEKGKTVVFFYENNPILNRLFEAFKEFLESWQTFLVNEGDGDELVIEYLDDLILVREAEKKLGWEKEEEVE